MKIALILFSHIALGLAGWGIAREFRSVSTPQQMEELRTQSNRPRSVSTMGSELVRSIETRWEESKAATALLAAQSGPRDKILTAISGLKLPADPDAAFHILLASDDETSSIQAAALFVLWMESDPKPALQFAAHDEELRAMSYDDEALELAGESIPLELALSMEDGHSRDSIFAGLARQLIDSHTIEELSILLGGLETDLKSDLSFHIGNQWPAERLDDFGRLVTAIGDPEMIALVREKLPPEEMARWIMRYVDEHPDPEFARSVETGGTLMWLLRDEFKIPLTDRLDRLVKRPIYSHQSPDIARKNTMEFLARHDVSRYFHNDGPDLRYAFHHSEIEAPEILAKLSARFPEYDAAGLLPALLHQQLSSEDPNRAAVLIAELPDTERARVIAESAWSISSLGSLSRVLSNFPVSDDKEILAYRQNIWQEFTDRGLDDYGKVYLRWISNLQNPLDRKMALEAIARRIK